MDCGKGIVCDLVVGDDNVVGMEYVDFVVVLFGFVEVGGNLFDVVVSY